MRANMGMYRRGLDPEQLKDQQLDWSLVRGVFRLARPYRLNLVMFGLSGLVSSIVGVVPPLFFKDVIDKAIPNRNVALLVELSSLAIGFTLGRSLLGLLTTWQASRIGNGLTFDLRTRLYEHVQSMPMAFFTRTQTGALMSRVNNDVTGAQEVLTEVISTLTTDVFGFVSTVVVMLKLDLRLTFVVLVAIPGFMVPAKYMGRVMQRITRQRFDLLSGMNAYLQERLNVAGALLAKLFGDPRRESEEFAGHARSVRDLGVRIALRSGLYRLTLNLYSSLAEAMIILFGGLLVIWGRATLGTVIAFRSYATRAYQPVNSLSSTRIQLMTATVSFERVFEILAHPNPIADGPDELVRPRGRVELDSVRFTYPSPASSTLESLGMPSAGDSLELPEVLHGISFVAEPGQMIALVGPSGAGKTTTLSLLPRLYDVTSGSVRIDGHDVRELTLASLRRAVGFVSQDPHLFHDTIRNNLLYARPGASPSELERACRIARIHDAIAALPEGYDTIVGERGYRLSGGEKQRVAIARMILKDPAVVVLDEATSHLDSENERLIKEALSEALAGRTTLAIAHRLSTIVAADRILAMENGVIVEQGPHSELLALGGRYSVLYRTQYERALASEPAPLA
jgi:ATP-binding cassette subfamily B protein